MLQYVIKEEGKQQTVLLVPLMKILFWVVTIVMAMVGIFASFIFGMPWLLVCSVVVAGFCLIVAANLLGRRDEAEPKRVKIKVVPPSQEPPP